MARYRLKDGTIFRPMVIPKIASLSSGIKDISLSDIEKKGDDLLYNNLRGYISGLDSQYKVPYLRYNNANSIISGKIVFNDLATVTFDNRKVNSDYVINIKYNCKDSSGSTAYFSVGDYSYYANLTQPVVSLIPAIYGIVPMVSIAVDNDNPDKVTTAALFYVRSWSNSTVDRQYQLRVLPIIGYEYVTLNNTLLQFFQNAENAVEEPVSQPIADENGFFDNSSDVIELPSIDTINIMSALTTSAVSEYKMTSASINSLMSLLWSEDFYNALIKNQQSPIDNIQKLTCYPFDVSAVEDSPVIIGNNVTNINGGVINAQFQEIDFGSVTITEYYGTALDYNGTDITIVLPFIGERQLSMPDIGSATISLKYRVDILTGNCVAIISAYRNRDNTELNSVIYQFSGNLANEFPLTQAVNKSLTKYQDAYYSLAQGNLVGAITTAGRELSNQATTGMPSMQYQRTGNLTASSGYMGVLTPYLIISRPVNIKPKAYDKYYGFPSFYTVKLSDCKGYTQIHELISDAPTGVPADDWEKIKQMLKDGIIIN